MERGVWTYDSVALHSLMSLSYLRAEGGGLPGFGLASNFPLLPFQHESLAT
jgi:hypothetical protein